MKKCLLSCILSTDTEKYNSWKLNRTGHLPVRSILSFVADGQPLWIGLNQHGNYSGSSLDGLWTSIGDFRFVQEFRKFWKGSLRSKRFRGVGEQRKTKERNRNGIFFCPWTPPKRLLRRLLERKWMGQKIFRETYQKKSKNFMPTIYIWKFLKLNAKEISWEKFSQS